MIRTELAQSVWRFSEKHALGTAQTAAKALCGLTRRAMMSSRRNFLICRPAARFTPYSAPLHRLWKQRVRPRPLA